MQPSSIEPGYLILAFALSSIVWLLVLRYRLRLEPEGRASWYARNINNPVREGLFSAIHFALVILLAWLVILLFAPSYFPGILKSTWVALPMFLFIGLLCGALFGTTIDDWRHVPSENESAEMESTAT